MDEQTTQIVQVLRGLIQLANSAEFKCDASGARQISALIQVAETLAATLEASDNASIKEESDVDLQE